MGCIVLCCWSDFHLLSILRGDEEIYYKGHFICKRSCFAANSYRSSIAI